MEYTVQLVIETRPKPQKNLRPGLPQSDSRFQKWLCILPYTWACADVPGTASSKAEEINQGLWPSPFSFLNDLHSKKLKDPVHVPQGSTVPSLTLKRATSNLRFSSLSLFHLLISQLFLIVGHLGKPISAPAACSLHPNTHSLWVEPRHYFNRVRIRRVHEQDEEDRPWVLSIRKQSCRCCYWRRSERQPT